VSPIPPLLNEKTEDIAIVEKRGAYTITIVGCGREGLTYGTAFAEAGFKVTFVDPDQSMAKGLARSRTEHESRLRSLYRTGRLAATGDLKNAVANGDAVMVTINPSIDENKNINYSEIEKACKQVGANLKRGTLVIYTGTACPGFTESVVREALVNASGLKLGEEFGLAYSPLLLVSGRPTPEAIFNLELNVAANDMVSLESASALMAVIAKRGIRQVTNFRKAELASLFSALRRDINIALNNELAILCEKTGVDYLEILKFIDPQQALPGFAPTIDQEVGREVYSLIESAENLNTKLRLATLARQVNEDMIRYAVNLTQNALRSCGRTLRRSKITVLGTTGAGTTGETFVKMLEKKGAKTIAYDPNAVASRNPNSLEKPKRTIADAVEGSDCLVLLQGQEQLRNLNLKNLRTVMRSPSAIIDLTGTLDPEKTETEGFIYRGLGRGIGKK